MSDLGTLRNCMVDSDAEALARGRMRRRAAMLIATTVEIAVVLAMLVWPLITPARLPRVEVVDALVPYSSNTSAPAHARAAARPRAARPSFHDQMLTSRPVRIRPEASAEDAGASAPEVPGLPGLGPTTDGPLIPGAEGRGLPPPPVAPRPTRPMRVSRGVMEASLIHRVEPVYPPIARTMNLAGEVRLRAIIGTDGRIERVDLISGSPVLAGAAIAAVRQWRYRPTLLSGEPVEVETYVTVTFTLE